MNSILPISMDLKLSIIEKITYTPLGILILGYDTFNYVYLAIFKDEQLADGLYIPTEVLKSELCNYGVCGHRYPKLLDKYYIVFLEPQEGIKKIYGYLQFDISKKKERLWIELNVKKKLK